MSVVVIAVAVAALAAVAAVVVVAVAVVALAVLVAVLIVVVDPTSSCLPRVGVAYYPTMVKNYILHSSVVVVVVGGVGCGD